MKGGNGKEMKKKKEKKEKEKKYFLSPGYGSDRKMQTKFLLQKRLYFKASPMYEPLYFSKNRDLKPNSTNHRKKKNTPFSNS